MTPYPPLNPSDDDQHAPDYELDHARWGGFDSQAAGCRVAQEEVIVDLERLTGYPHDDHGRLDQEEFDTSLIEGEAWGDMYKD